MIISLVFFNGVGCNKAIFAFTNTVRYLGIGTVKYF